MFLINRNVRCTMKYNTPLIVSIFFTLTTLSLVFEKQAQAEPWLSNRFANNCAACHAPGRINRTVKKRRCTLSCQGCHVNPNGGGLRNAYGKWNSRRFLKSFSTKHGWDEPLPAPFSKQRYARRKVKKKVSKKWAQKGAKLVTRKGVSYKVSDYEDKTNYKKTARSLIQDLMYIPEDDPFRIERTTDIYASGDARFFFLNIDRGGDSEPESFFFPMAFDAGLRIRPFRNHRFSFVYETRAFSRADDRSLDALIGANQGNMQTRSAYLLYDDLPYNGYAQFGFYRPLFGLYNPNHTNLFANFSGLDQNSTFKGLSVGVAPNVPFFTFNWLTEANNASEINPSFGAEEGFVVTAGLRGVTKGWSLVSSYWSTVHKLREQRRVMFDVNAGGQFGPVTVNLDFLRVDFNSGGIRDAATVITLETKYRIFREFYAQLNYAQANAALGGGPNFIQKGTESEISGGLKMFFLAGTELEFLYQVRNRKPEARAQSQLTTILGQFHLYF